MPRDISQMAESMRQLLADTHQSNLHAQAHARNTLHQLDAAVDDLPKFSTDLDERLVYGSHLMLVNGLELVRTSPYQALGKKLLARGAETLEFLCEGGSKRISRPDELMRAAVAYHIGEYHARAYVLCGGLADSEGSDSFPNAILALLNRDLRLVAEMSHRILASPNHRDEAVTDALRNGNISDDDALSMLAHRSLLQALAFYSEYTKRGRADHLTTAIGLCRQVAVLGLNGRHVDTWWWGSATELLLGDLGESSLWQSLGDISPVNPWGRAIDRYIEGGLSSTPVTVSLWPSQLKALATIKDPTAPSFCVRMPTSAGKTKIAELAIVKAILDAPLGDDAKCLYVAPFRSLAVEIESALSKGLGALGVRVSEIYGGFDLTVTDERLIRETQVLVATPEKFDAVLRLSPELLDNVRLIVVDEGHIAGDTSERGVRAEFLINRLIARLGREKCRHVFISAVLPNPSEFAAWIAGDPSSVIESDWRPARLAFGECQWNGRSVRLDFTHDGSNKLKEPFFVPRFAKVENVKGLHGAGRRRKPFPDSANEAFCLAAIKFSVRGSTLAFVPQARQVESMARTVLVSLNLLRALAESEGAEEAFIPPAKSSVLLQECLEVMQAELGSDSEAARFLSAGIAIHHGSLPGRVRVAIERLVRSGEVKLTIATSTLGQGVNLPIRTVLVRGVQRGAKDKVDPMTLWNIAGRAGRALRENEGQVLFFNDTTRPKGVVRRQRKFVAAVIDRSAIEDVVGSLHRILERLRSKWTKRFPAASFEELCLRLAEDDFDWSSDADRPDFVGLFEVVDQHLLALAVEGDFGPDDSDALQEILRDSLLFAQLESRPLEGINREGAQMLLASRLRSVFSRFPQKARRARFYRMGFSLADCVLVEDMSEEFIDAFRRSASWADQDEAWHLELLLEVAGYALRVPACLMAAKRVPDNVLEIVRVWLLGSRGFEVASAGLAPAFKNDPGKTGRFLEDLCVYGLAWVVSGLVDFARQELEEELPTVAEFLPSMFKLGVCDPLTAIFVPYLGGEREFARVAARTCSYPFTDVKRSLAWLHGLTPGALMNLGVSPVTAAGICSSLRIRPEFDGLLNPDIDFELTVAVPADLIKSLTLGEALAFHVVDASNKQFQLRTLFGELLGSYRISRGSLPSWVAECHRVVTTVMDFVDVGTGRGIKIGLRQLG